MGAATKQDTATNLAIIDVHDGRDELNLSEFPICYLGDRIPSDIEELSFQKEEWDTNLKQLVVRRRVISAPSSVGLPVIYDSKVLLGILALGHAKNGFTSPEVCFSRYELSQVLGLPDNGKTYRRLEKSLKRWGHVTITNENSWRDNHKQRYRDEVFSIFESVEIEGRSGGGKQLDLPLSKVRFSSVFFKSLSSNNIKHLDLGFYCSLSQYTAAHAYRVLGKYLWRDKGVVEMDLMQFAVQHVGLSHKYKPTDAKRKLKPGIEELEESGYIEAATPDERYKKGEKRGEWKIRFARGKRFKDPKLPCKDEADRVTDDPLIAQLVDRGVTKKIASRLVGEAVSGEDDSLFASQAITRDHIALMVEYLDCELDQGKKISNPGAWLRTAIEDGYATPDGFMTKSERDEQKRRLKARKKAKATKDQQFRQAEEERIKASKQQAAEEWQRVEEYLDSLAQTEREALLDEVIAAADQFSLPYLKRYRLNPDATGLDELVSQQCLVKHILPTIQETSPA